MENDRCVEKAKKNKKTTDHIHSNARIISQKKAGETIY